MTIEEQRIINQRLAENGRKGVVFLDTESAAKLKTELAKCERDIEAADKRLKVLQARRWRLMKALSDAPIASKSDHCEKGEHPRCLFRYRTTRAHYCNCKCHAVGDATGGKGE